MKRFRTSSILGAFTLAGAMGTQADAAVIVLDDMQDPDTGSTTAAQFTAETTIGRVTASALTADDPNIRTYDSSATNDDFEGDLLLGGITGLKSIK